MNILMPAINTYLKRCISAKLSTVDTQLSRKLRPKTSMSYEKKRGCRTELFELRSEVRSVGPIKRNLRFPSGRGVVAGSAAAIQRQSRQAEFEHRLPFQ